VGHSPRYLLAIVNILEGMKTLQKIGHNIAQARKDAGFSQEDLAGLAEMDRSYLSEIENGKKNLSVLALLKIAKALGVEVGELLG
jgi:transcriptional regulator with XRE-family HTH domain